MYERRRAVFHQQTFEEDEKKSFQIFWNGRKKRRKKGGTTWQSNSIHHLFEDIKTQHQIIHSYRHSLKENILLSLSPLFCCSYFCLGPLLSCCMLILQKYINAEIVFEEKGQNLGTFILDLKFCCKANKQSLFQKGENLI